MSKDYKTKKFKLSEDISGYYLMSVKRGKLKATEFYTHVNRVKPDISIGQLQKDGEACQPVAVNLLLEGYEIEFPPFGSFELILSGTVDDRNKGFDPKIHKVHIKFRESKELISELEDLLVVNKMETRIQEPSFHSFYNKTLKSETATINPQNLIELTGKNLKFDESDSSQGLFFIHSSTATVTRADEVSHNTQSIIKVKVPADLSPGEYRVEVKTKVADRERTGMYKQILQLI